MDQLTNELGIHHFVADLENALFSIDIAPESQDQFAFTQEGLGVGNRSKRGKCGSAPTQKSQWGVRLAGRTHIHG